MGDNYFIITSGEDGINIRGPMTKSVLLRRLKSDYGEDTVFLSEVPDIDKGCFLGHSFGMVIIKGDIVVPKEKRVVTEYDIA